ncbi:MAG TPA: helix-turn-helix domain-containing protein [Dokdonella sp.]|uniref:GlxA family transcriptional regulator n=1 Tax=Dokdonella sp. TaxID=2291710 RepID=UPI002C163143|nr:helix-turn-helix domain-containing protein [Dokdonella sp.]HUD43031.1 helix-turn-helix domain-containing protein [Dokdonella sp.]
MLVYDGAQSLDVSGPLEVFALADRQAREDAPDTPPLYRLHLLARGTGPVTTASGLRLLPDLRCEDLPADTDTLLVCGGMGDALDRARADTALVGWLREVAPRVPRIASVCSGALLLAEAGLLDGRRATTHWRDLADLRRYRRVQVEPDAIYTHDGTVWTSAGITAGMDLALAMVTADHGLPLALKVAKRMVMASKRAGGQSQFSDALQVLDLPGPLARLAVWIGENLQADLDAARLAQRLHLSPRQLARRFADAFGTTPRTYVEQRRVEAAKPLLEHTSRDLKRIAADCGFASAEAMRRAFVRRLGVSPGEYRSRFGTP